MLQENAVTTNDHEERNAQDAYATELENEHAWKDLGRSDAFLQRTHDMIKSLFRQREWDGD